MTIQAVRGMKDVLEPETSKWRFLEDTAREVFARFGFQEIRTPILEKTELFLRSIGETTDIVEKEMYTFEDRGGDSLTMRPEATAGVVRAYLENKLHGQPGPHKFFTIGPMFRRERPQKGRFRQFHQLDVEVLDDAGPMMDAEIMVMLAQLLNRLGLSAVSLIINSLGCPACRPAYREALLAHFDSRREALCPDCRRRLDTNPLRVLDCKVEACGQQAEGAPTMADHLCPACREHHRTVKDLLDLSGIDYQEDPRLVRGLDYYSRTAFEAKAGRLGAQNAVAGGGRYDGLLQELGGPPTPAIGFALGLERLALLVEDRPEWNPPPDLFIISLGDEPRKAAFGLAGRLRSAGLRVEMMSQDKSMKAQMRRANKLAAPRVAILGPDELERGRIILKDMAGGGQAEYSLSDLDPEDLAAAEIPA